MLNVLCYITQKTLNAVSSQMRDIQDADHLSYTFQMFTVQPVKLLPCVQNKLGASERA